MLALNAPKIITLLIIKLMIIEYIFCEEKISSRLENLENCGGEFSGYQYSITSPNYPENYPKNRDCVYFLRGSPLAKCDQIFNLHFLEFQLTATEDCKDDFVQIGDRSLFCGYVVGIKRYSGANNNNTLNIRFHSGGQSGKGFKILVTTLPCSVPSVVPISNETRGTLNDEEASIQDGTFGFQDKETLTESPIYPVYRPDNPFTIEENARPYQEILPEKLEVLDVKSLESFETPTYNSNLFQTETNYVKSASNLTRPTKISAYFFAPPDFQDTKSSNTIDNNNVKFNSISNLPSEILLPTKEHINFESKNLNDIPKIENIQTNSRRNQNLVIPAISYGIPADVSYSNFGLVEPQIKTGEVLENSRENADCEGKANIDTFVPVLTNFRDSIPLANNYPSNVFTPGGTTYPATIYGAPGSQFPLPPLPNFNVNQEIPSNNYGPSLIYSGPNNNQLPNGLLPQPNIRTFFPGNRPIIPNINTLGQCCRSLYSSQRLLLASPGFPSLLHSENNYQCAYTIAPFSSNVCRLRLHFKFFNYGAEDQFCRYGHLEIDGRSYCGCKTGLTVVSNVANWFTKTISVKYVGYPKTKLNGFLIEIVQETCPYNGYPYLSRSKKHISNTSFAEGVIEKTNNFTNNSSVLLKREKRELGYSYPKPSIPFNNIGEQLFTSGGVGHLGFTSATQCQAFKFVNWGLAAKETYLQNAKCIRTDGGGGLVPGQPGNWIPTYPGNGNLNPGYPGAGNNFPGNNFPGNNIPSNNFPGNNIPVNNFPGNNFPGNNFPGNNFPGNNFPGNNIPGNNFPGNNFPGNNLPGNNQPGNNFPGYPISGGPSGGYLPGNNGNGNGLYPPGSCETIVVPEGRLSTPQYPNPYPNNFKTCFRFFQAPDSCKLQLAILDFDIQASPGCIKDYLVIGNQNIRYCGKTLAGSKTLLDFPRNGIIDILFFADSYGTGRGFNIGFNQVSCPLVINR